MVNGSISVCCQMSGFCRSSVVALLAYEDVEESLSSGSAAKILQTNQENQ